MEKVRVYLKFKSKNEKEPSFDEFVAFLNAVNDFHNLLIFFSQDNYNKEDYTDEKSVLILMEHRLIIADVKRENPFIFDFIFNVDPYQFVEFLKTLKMCFLMCGMFGKVSFDIAADIIHFLKKLKTNKKKIKDGKELMREAILFDSKYKKYIEKFCGDGSKIIDLIYYFKEEEFKIIENEKYKEDE